MFSSHLTLNKFYFLNNRSLIYVQNSRLKRKQKFPRREKEYNLLGERINSGLGAKTKKLSIFSHGKLGREGCRLLHPLRGCS